MVNVLRNLRWILSKNSPVIFTGLAVVGVAGTVASAIHATPKALLLLDEESERRRKEHDKRPINKLDVVKICWKCYIPTIALGAATVACIIGANTVNSKRISTLAGIYSLSDTAFRQYKEKVAETIGRSKERKIRDDISADTIRKNPPSTNEIIISGKGDVLCYDSLTGRYFSSDVEKIRRLMNDFNQQLFNEMFLSLNEWYYLLGLPPVKLGDNAGWSIEKGKLTVSFGAQLTENDTPCIVVYYDTEPQPKYL